MKVAIEGCCHGELDRIYEVLGKVEEKEGYKIDLLICCGDFQAVRNSEDLNCMAVPMKYRYMQSFYKYYSGAKKAPILTLFIGGNHEASNHLWELSYGGWVAPNIYYLGHAGVVRCGGLRIAGLSGIFKEFDYRKNHFECPPYNQSTIRSTYHVRSCDIFRMRQLTGKFDIGLSHDWPQRIYNYGDRFLLLRLKPFFGEELLLDHYELPFISAPTESYPQFRSACSVVTSPETMLMHNNTLGSLPAMELLQQLQPTYWFSAHLHVKFSALYAHTSSKSTSEASKLEGERHLTETGKVSTSAEEPKESSFVTKKLLDQDTDSGSNVEGAGEASSGSNVEGAGEADSGSNVEGAGEADSGSNVEGAGEASSNVEGAGEADSGSNVEGVGEADSGSNVEGAGEASSNVEGAGEADSGSNVEGAGEADSGSNVEGAGEASSNVIGAGEADSGSNVEGAGEAGSGSNVECAGDSKGGNDGEKLNEHEAATSGEGVVTNERVIVEEVVSKLAEEKDSGTETSTVVANEKSKAPSGNVDSCYKHGEFTKFLALDKVLPRRRFLQVLDINPCDGVDVERPYRLEYDQEWLAIVKSTETHMKYNESMWLPPHKLTDERVLFTPTEEELLDVRERFLGVGSGSHLYIPENFVLTAASYVEKTPVDYSAIAKARENSQTLEFCEKLGIANPFTPKEFGIPEVTSNPDEIDVDEEGDHQCSEETEDNRDVVKRPPLALPPPANTLTTEAFETGTEDEPCGEEKTEKVPIDVQMEESSTQSIKRSRPDDNPECAMSEDRTCASDDVIADDSIKQDEPLIKRRNVAIYSEDETTVENS